VHAQHSIRAQEHIQGIEAQSRIKAASVNVPHSLRIEELSIEEQEHCRTCTTVPLAKH
jgi:hypothetical protein